MGILDFIQDEILGMKWLNRLIGSVLNACGLDTSGKIGGSVQFFIYDVIKIMVQLGVLIFFISYIQSYFPPERTKKILGRFHGIGANCIAALLGTVTPFCSCSSIPLFMGFTSAGLPLGVTFSFLISSPMVDLGSLILCIPGIVHPTAIPAVPSTPHFTGCSGKFSFFSDIFFLSVHPAQRTSAQICSGVRRFAFSTSSTA